MNTISRKALLALVLLVPAQGIATAMFFWRAETTTGKFIFVACKVWMALLPVVWLKFVDREPLSWSPPRLGGFGVGAVLGLVIAAVIFAGYGIALHLHVIHPEKIAGRAAQTGLNHLNAYIGSAIGWVTVNSLMEEYVWRWFVFRKFEVLLGGKPAVIAAALAFTAHHVIVLMAQFNWPIVVLGSAGVFIGGAAWSWLYLRYRSVWPGYLSHAIVDAAIFVIGYWLIFGGK
ncbi:MAG TPA: CPBP family intramembrane glutamic endopeptidase [Verrucomicrobiae bacterium]|nr:CPBP family intramembrane glutamic endopeptidase [Verrucomicrobiae bacterium]